MTNDARNPRRKEQSEGRIKLRKLLLSSCFGMAFLAVFLLFAAVICLGTDAADHILSLSAYLCCALSAFPAGFIAAKSVGKSGLLCGLLSSAPICTLLLIFCLSFFGSVGSGFLIGCALILFFGALGGVTALNLRRRRRYR